MCRAAPTSKTCTSHVHSSLSFYPALVVVLSSSLPTSLFLSLSPSPSLPPHPLSSLYHETEVPLGHLSYHAASRIICSSMYDTLSYGARLILPVRITASSLVRNCWQIRRASFIKYKPAKDGAGEGKLCNSFGTRSMPRHVSRAQSLVKY